MMNQINISRKKYFHLVFLRKQCKNYVRKLYSKDDALTKIGFANTLINFYQYFQYFFIA